jgi:hypothetical protein
VWPEDTEAWGAEGIMTVLVVFSHSTRRLLLWPALSANRVLPCAEFSRRVCQTSSFPASALRRAWFRHGLCQKPWRIHRRA